MGLTPHELRALDVIKEFFATRGFAPTVRELMAMLELKSTSFAASTLEALEYKGYVRRLSRRSRAIEIIEAPKCCPHCGGDLNAKPVTKPRHPISIAAARARQGVGV